MRHRLKCHSLGAQFIVDAVHVIGYERYDDAERRSIRWRRLLHGRAQADPEESGAEAYAIDPGEALIQHQLERQRFAAEIARSSQDPSHRGR